MIKYIKDIKYQLQQDYEIRTNIIGYDVETDFIKLTLIGVLTIRKGYPWDGPSGPTIDTKNSMRGSLVHDAFYELMRKGLVSRDERNAVDRLFRQILVDDGMRKSRADIWYKAVHALAGFAADPENKRKIYTAP